MTRVLTAVLAVMVAASAVAAAAAKYEATWESIDSRPTPAWFKEARFGIFIHWGLYSVPAWGPKGQYAEWYWNHLNRKDFPTKDWQARVYGPEFTYFDFAPMFKAELFDPDQWADIFLRSGAKYIVLTSKHHEGYCLWPNEQANKTWGRPWNSMDIGAKRDLLGDLTKAVKAKGMKMGYYYSLYEWYNPLYKPQFEKFRDEHYFPQIKDLVTRYQPAMVWTDGEWEHTSAEWKSPELLAWLFNNCANPDELVINDRWGKETRGRHGGFYTTEYGGHTQAEMSADHPWEECRGMGASFGWNRNETIDEYSTDAALIRLLADTVGRGGNLLLDIGPTGDGRIPVIMQERLIQIGAWLKTNGEAVYGTDGGPFGGAGKGRWTATTRPGKLYVHVFQRPADGLLRLPGLVNKVAKAALLDGGAAVEVKADPAGPVLTLPACLPDARVTVVVLDIEGPPRVETVPVAQGADGKVELRAADATIHGTTAKYEDKGDNIGFWSRTQDTVSWDVQVAGPGTFAVAVTWACAPGSGGEYAVTAGDAKVEAKVAETGAWATFKTENIGTLALGAGKVTVAVKPKSKKGEGLMNLRSIVLVPQK